MSLFIPLSDQPPQWGALLIAKEEKVSTIVNFRNCQGNESPPNGGFRGLIYSDDISSVIRVVILASAFSASRWTVS